MEAVKPSGSRFVGTAGEDAEEDDGFNRDSARIKQILPPEIWLLVAEKVKERRAADLENLTNSSKFFQKLLASQRTTFLFEKVFPLVVQSVWRKEGLEGLPVSDVLRCREVSKEWSAAVDKFVGEKLEYFGSDSSGDPDDIGDDALETISTNHKFNNLTMDVGDFKRTKSVETFLRHFELSHTANGRSPWVGGHISVDIFPEDFRSVRDYPGFLEGISTLLSKYGGHLESFSVKIHRSQVFQNLSLLQQWLLQMSNLKTLSLVNEGSWPPPRRGNLEEVIEGHPFPKLEYLEKMHISNLPPEIFNQLIGQNNHVIKLSVENLKVVYKLSNLFPNLKYFEASGSAGSVLRKLGSLREDHFRALESLKLVIFGRVKTAKLFELIENKFARNLVSLTLEIGGDGGTRKNLWVSGDLKKCRLNLPNLKRFFLKIDVNPVCLDFLFPMKNTLEEISLRIGYTIMPCNSILERSGGGSSAEKFVDLEEKPVSNVWAVFKKLRKFKVVGVPKKPWRQ